MNRDKTILFTERLLAIYGLKGWRCTIIANRRTLGRCHYTHKEIQISIHLIENSPHEVVETVLHEIAHALAGHDAGHGPKWKEKCLLVGCKPKATASNVDMGCAPWIIWCPTCNSRYPRWKHGEHPKGRCAVCAKRRVTSKLWFVDNPDFKGVV